jgi:hypothetical protein
MVKYGEKYCLHLCRKRVCLALERFLDLDYVSVLKYDLGPQKPHFRPLVQNILLQNKNKLFSGYVDVVCLSLIRTVLSTQYSHNNIQNEIRK